jgi:hypothetical protein
LLLQQLQPIQYAALLLPTPLRALALILLLLLRALAMRLPY